MSYQVIARKWRPQTFEEVTGQEHITRTLRNAVEHERLHHAYLFSGARGVGKTTTARLLAKAVNCHKSDRPVPTPCRTTDPDACVSCREIAESRSIDVLEIDAASNTGIDNVRDVIINTIGTHPARDRYKVFIIDEVHMLSTPAFNALLKTLEEPPPRVLFIMATTHAHKVPETILSRSQQFEFRTISTAKIAERLRLIADAEQLKVTDDALREVARAGEGSMRDAQSAFDQVISFSEGKIEAPDVEAALGIAGSEMLSRVMRAVAGEKPADALAVVEELSARGHELRNFCRDLLAHLRDLLVFKVAGDAALADATEAERSALRDEVRDFSESDLVRFFHSLTDTEARLSSGAHPRYQLEVGLVKLVEMRRLAPLGRIVERLNALEEALRTGRAPAGGTNPPPSSAPPSSSTPPRRGAAGGGGAASFSGTDAALAAEPERLTAKSAEAEPPAVQAAPVAPQANGRAQVQSSPNLKLVPPPAQSGGAASFAEGAAARAAEAPFALSEGAPAAGLFEAPRPFVEGVREDAVGAPVSLVPAEAPAPDFIPGGPGKVEMGFGADDEASRFKCGLEGRGRPLLAVALDGARRVWVDGEEVRVEFAPEGKHLYETLRKAESQKLLREVCCEVLNRAVGIDIKMKEPGESEDDAQLTPDDEARREQRALRERAESHPVVQQLLKTFRAEVVEVRRTDNAPPPPSQ
jgi:DNA polymerase-3 subunit gamma/tau